MRAKHSDINLLREPPSGARGARHPHVLNVHSDACAPGFPDVGSLATISVAMSSFLITIALLSTLAPAHAEEVEPTLELIEWLGEMDIDESDIDIVMANLKESSDQKKSLSQEVKDEK